MSDKEPDSPLQPENPALPDSFLWLRTQDLDEARATITRAYDPHQLESHNPLKDSDISLHHASLNSVSLSIIQYDTDVTATVDELTGVYVFMPLQGQLELVCDGLHYQCEPGSGLVINAGSSIVKTMRGGFRQLVIKFNPEAIHRYLISLHRFAVEQDIAFQPHLEQQGRTRSWWRSVKHVMDELADIDPSCPQQMMTEVFEQLLTQSLVCSQPHNYSEALYSPKERNLVPWYVKKAEDFIEVNAANSLTMADVAEAAGVSERSLQNAFKKSKGLSPMQYLRDVRLEMANKALLTAAPDDSVTPVAISCGFRQLSRFAQQYKTRYGELPSETLQRTMQVNPSILDL
jgi:AraC-like DNA-binding protein